MTSMLRSVVAAAMAAGAVACGDVGPSNAEFDDLRSQLAERTQAQAQLEDRLDQLEGAMDRLLSERAADDTAAHVATIEQDLSQVVDALTVLEVTLHAEVGDRKSFADDVDSAAADLRRSVSTLQGSVDEVTGEIEELRTLYVTLRDRLDRLQRGG